MIVGDPALVGHVFEHLPLAGPGHINLMSKNPCKYQVLPSMSLHFYFSIILFVEFFGELFDLLTSFEMTFVILFALEAIIFSRIYTIFCFTLNMVNVDLFNFGHASYSFS